MSTRKPFAGTWTALITPFTSDGSVDEAALRGLVKRQIEAGVTGILPLGTTGESPTVEEDEARTIFQIVIEECQGTDVRVMAGTGSNSTRHSIERTQMAKDLGADIALVVCPYYNKPTPEGLKLHFTAIADVGMPVCIYNIKGRTGINMDTDTLMELAQHPQIVAVKEASGDLKQMKEVIARRPSDKGFTVLSGDDGLTLDLIKAGGDGVVSVASNLMPREISEMVENALTGNMTEAEAANESLQKLFKDIFVETNPIPVKYLAYKMGLVQREYRLPMCPPTHQTQQQLDELGKTYNLI